MDTVMTDRTAQPALGDMPGEILSDISSRLRSDEMFALRLTCRAVEQKTFAQFANEYFRAKAFLFTSESLRTLLQIAQSEKLRGYLNRVFLVGWALNQTVINQTPHFVRGFSPSAIGVVKEYAADQKELKRRGRQAGGDLRYLIDAFKRLPALYHLSVVHSESGLPHDVICHGMNKIMRKTRALPSLPLGCSRGIGKPDPCCLWTQHICSTTLLAIVGSNTATLEELEMHTDILMMTRLKLTPAQWSALGRCFAKLQEVRFRFLLGHWEFALDGLSEKIMQKAMTTAEHFSKTFKHATGFTFVGHRVLKPVEVLESLLTTMSVANLTSFRIEELHVEEDKLLTIIKELKSMTYLLLDHVKLVSGSWVPILEAILTLPKLQHLDLSALHVNNECVQFYRDPSPTGSEISDMSDWSDDGMLPDVVLGPMIGGVPLVLTKVAEFSNRVGPTSGCTRRPGEIECRYRHNPDLEVHCLHGDEVAEELPEFIDNYHTVQRTCRNACSCTHEHGDDSHPDGA